MNVKDNSMMSHEIVQCDSRHLWTAYDRFQRKMMVVTAETLREEPERWLIPVKGGEWRSITTVTKRPSKPVQCVLVDDPHHVYELENGTLTHNTGGGKSVLQRNVVFHCIAHAREIKFFGIDLKKVELSSYREYAPVLFIATTLQDAVGVLEVAQDEMMSRYSEMEAHGVQNFLDLENPGSALLVMVDEAGELLDTSSPAKALADDTPIPTSEGMKRLGDIRVGDKVLGTDLLYHDVLDTYEPVAQEHYKVQVSNSTGESESFVAGGEHLWRVWFPERLAGVIQSLVVPSRSEEFEGKHGETEYYTAVLTTESLGTLKTIVQPEDWASIKLRRNKIPEVME